MFERHILSSLDFGPLWTTKELSQVRQKLAVAEAKWNEYAQDCSLDLRTLYGGGVPHCVY